MTSLESKKRWRDANPEKIKAQRERRKARQAALSEAEKAVLSEKRRAYNLAYRAAHKDDPEAREKARLRHQKAYRLRMGYPLEGPLPHRQKKQAAEERRAALRERKHREYLKRKEAAKLTAQRRAEEKAAAERAKRRAEPIRVILTECRKPAPVDPPELVALFAKASKGEPPRPYNPKGRKVSVFAFRGAR